MTTKRKDRRPTTGEGKSRPKKAASKKKKEGRGNYGAHRPSSISQESIDRIVAILRLGSYVEQACAQVGISKDTFYAWQKRGAIERKRRHRVAMDRDEEAAIDSQRTRKMRSEEITRRSVRDVEDSAMSLREEIFLSFSDSVERASAEGETAMLSIVAKAATGGAVNRRTTRTLSDGSTQTTESLTAPDWRAAAWRLEKRYPKRWGIQQVDVDVSGDIAVTTAVVARDRLVAALARISGAKQPTVEVSATTEQPASEVESDVDDS